MLGEAGLSVQRRVIACMCWGKQDTNKQHICRCGAQSLAEDTNKHYKCTLLSIKEDKRSNKFSAWCFWDPRN